jgi:feruloyl esterase
LAVVPNEASAAPTAPMDSAARCQALARLDWPGVEITSAEIVPAAPAGTVPYAPGVKATIPVALPEHCRVEGVIDRRKGADGVVYGIGFAINLPSNWNGRFMFQGGGGFDGHIEEPRGFGDNPVLAQRWAIIATDSGHRGDTFDTTFMNDQQAGLDFAFNSVPAVTRLGKALVQAYYGRAPDHSYSIGCSTGGREGMLAAERFPDLFDGVISGDPAMRSDATRIAGWNATVAFNRISPKDADGKPLRLLGFPLEDQKLLHDAVAKQCDGLDGLQDGLILDLAACKFDPSVLQCKAGKTPDCLSADQVAALKAAFGGPKDAHGEPLYVGFPYDLGLLGGQADTPMHILPANVPGIYDEPPSPFVFDYAAELARVRSNSIQILSDTDKSTDLGTFYRRGGKIIFSHGASDPWFSLYDTVDYFERNKAANPDFDSSRLYSVPGMGHCQGGGLQDFDPTAALVDWVEHGKAPGALVARDITRTVARPLCPWPQYARYKGAGDPNDPANFECKGG